MIIRGIDVIAVPMTYYEEFRRDPVDSLLKYGSMPQRARAPWFTDTKSITRALTLPDFVTGPTAERTKADIDYLSLVASSDDHTLLNGIDPRFRATDDSYWHVHVDLALNKKRHGDAAGIALGRITEAMVERSKDPLQNAYERVIRTYEVPLVAQIVAPSGDQIYLSSIVRLILQLKQIRGFNITSFSFDGFQSAMAAQELMLAGLVTAGMVIDPFTGEITGLPKPFSVDGRSVQPYRELLEAANEGRVAIAKYELLRRELREVEVVDPGFAPDHPIGGSKDVADPVAGVIGYLAAFGHAALDVEPVVVDRTDLEQAYDLDPVRDFGIDDDPFSWDFEPAEVSFTID